MVNVLPVIGAIAATITDFSTYPLSPGFDIKAVASQAEALPSHSWEYGAATEALLELYNPDLSVFGARPFPVPTLQKDSVRALAYLAPKVKFGTGYSALDKGNGAAGDPASMGVGAVMLGKTNVTFAMAANETVRGLLEDVPRFSNGAISHRANVAELWADFMYMVPPFLAYYAADTRNESLLQTTVTQCQLYRQILQPPSGGLWHHIIGPESQDLGLWSTGNAWAAAGMTRVLATVLKSSSFITDPAWQAQAVGDLTQYIQEILDGAIASPPDAQSGGLMRNYLDDTSGDGHGFGEIAGSSMLAATVYRMAVLQPLTFASSNSKYIQWADTLRASLSSSSSSSGTPHITSTGIATPAVNPLGWLDTQPYTTGSPEGQAMVVLMYAAWRDCVRAGPCVDGAQGEEIVSNAIVSNAGVGVIAKRSSHGGLHRRFDSHLLSGASH